MKVIKGAELDFIAKFQINPPVGDPVDVSTYDEIRFCFVKEDGTDLYKKRIITTGDVANLSAIIMNIPDTSDLEVGDLVQGTGIPADSRILTIDSATQITLDTPATATNTGVSLTIGDVTINGNPILGKVEVMLSESDTDSLPAGTNSIECKLINGGVTSYVQFRNVLQVVDRFC